MTEMKCASCIKVIEIKQVFFTSLSVNVVNIVSSDLCICQYMTNLFNWQETIFHLLRKIIYYHTHSLSSSEFSLHAVIFHLFDKKDLFLKWLSFTYPMCHRERQVKVISSFFVQCQTPSSWPEEERCDVLHTLVTSKWIARCIYCPLAEELTLMEHGKWNKIHQIFKR